VAEINGVVVMRYGRGDFFGELALVTRAPRKATVRAVGPTGVRCLSLAREDFDSPEFSDAMIWEKIFTDSPAARYAPSAAAAAAAAAASGSPRDRVGSPKNGSQSVPVSRTTSVGSDSFALQMEAAGLAMMPDEEFTASETSEDEGGSRLYQTTKRALLRERAGVRAYHVSVVACSRNFELTV